MEITYCSLTTEGPVRPTNEDNLGFWQPEDPEDRRVRGSVAVLADGVAGLGRGDVASRTAVEQAVLKFKESSSTATPKALLQQMFNAANLAIFDAIMSDQERRRMSTTMTATIFRNSELTIGHVGDCRVYVVQQGKIRRFTSDHSYAGIQVKMGLITEAEAMTSKFRYMLTRNLGQEPFIKVDLEIVDLSVGDIVLQCSDGLHGAVMEAEILDVLLHSSPAEACQKLVELAVKRGTEDNTSVQVAKIERVERVAYYRGLPLYTQPAPPPASATEAVQVGQVLDGRFEITGVINEGGMASIYKATDKQGEQPVALKIPQPKFESDPGAFSRFEREEQIGRSLHHPYLLKYIPVENRSRPYLAMELLEGQTLSQLLGQVGPLPEADALRITSRLCDALSYLHEKKIIHRDLKPQNVMVCQDGSLRIMDFGIAKAADSRKITFAGFSPTIGTPDYMAPEQVKGQRGDERTDIYSLGAMLYEMLTGTVPYQGANAFVVMNARLSGDPVAPRKLRADLTPQAEEIILHAMERDPALRYPSVAAMKADLDGPAQVPLTGRHERLRPPRPWNLRWRRIRAGVIALFITLAAFALVVLSSRRH
jgi:serine/threonine-protein kinase